jgi:hypothetical protein
VGASREAWGQRRSYPAAVIERIADSLSTTFKENKDRIPDELWQGLNKEWGMPAS